MLLGRTKNLTFNELVTLCQETDTESRAIHLSEEWSNPHSRNHQGHMHPRTTTTTAPPTPSPTAANNGPIHTHHPDAMDLSAMNARRKISEEERAARLREGRCHYCGRVEHLARNCPNKTRNPFCAAAAQVDPNPNLDPNTIANHPNANPNLNTSTDPFSGGGGGNWGSGGNGGQG